MGRSLRALLSAAVMVLVGLVWVPAGLAPTANAAIDPVDLGTTQATAAGSCWEIKQSVPTAASGVYWLLTPKMSQPKEYYCDMVTDGGGWVLIGKGRDAWTNDYDGKGSASDLVSPDTVPMSATTTQLASDQVDALMNGQRVDSLTDGVRLRRARDSTGSTWQEVRIKFASRSRFTWTFGAEFALTSYSFDGTTGTGGTSPSFGLDNSYRRVINNTTAAMGYRTGFAYGSGVAGSSSETTYLYSATNGAGSALPYTQVYLRPKVLSTDAGFTSIPTSGTAAITRPAVARSTALASPWGVTGTAGSTADEGNVEVQAFTQSGDRMYVGGNFRYVQQDEAGTGRVEQPFLAAFDINTGEWISSFRPVLNEQVRALATLPSGEVLAAGDFTSANGASATAIVALNPDTGASSTTWNATIENRISGGTLRVNGLDIGGDEVYIGGALTHVSGGTRTTPVYMRNLARVSATNGTPVTGWNPNLNGTVVDVDVSADLSRVYASGYFTTSNGVAASKAAAVQTAAGAALVSPSWTPTWSASANYQQAIEEVGNRVWVGGSEHSLFRFSTTTFAREAGNIYKNHGDVQAITEDRGVVYAGCHCDRYDYTNAYTWPTLSSGWTQADAIGWFAAYDGTTTERIPTFVPTFDFRLNEGIWALKADSNGTVWAGGDVRSVRTNAQQARWSGGFARFPLADSTPPETPADFRVTSQDATTVTLAWSSVSDATGGVRYEVLRDDRTIGIADTTSITVPKGGDNKFFLRAIDSPGNVSASTSVLYVGVDPPVSAFTWSASGLDASFDASTSSASAVDFAWSFGDGTTGAGETTSHQFAEPGTYTVGLTVTDSLGLSSSSQQDVEVHEVGDTVVVPSNSTWSWSYPTAAPAATWTTTSFDASSWSSGAGTLGFGTTVSLATNIDTYATTSARPLTAYFRKAFTVDNAADVTRLVLTSVADDGAVFYVNGTEVGRSNMPAGTITHSTYASSARNTTVANASPVVIEVPTSLLVSGANVIAVETHLNFRATKDLSFDLSAVLTSS